ncbi:MAG: PsbP-related protein [Methanobacteriaceae archaeon]|nr:PsbP-related protein [Methanobacteriaceae archaeon]
MKKYLPILAIIALVVAVAGCVDSGTNDTTINTTVPDMPSKTYAKNGISFEYPVGWTKAASSNIPGTIVGYGDPESVSKDLTYNTIAIVSKQALPSGSTVKESFDATYEQYVNNGTGYNLISERTLNINGVTAYEKVYNITVSGVKKEERATWFDANGTIYMVLCNALPKDFDSQQTNFDLITFSFKVTA